MTANKIIITKASGERVPFSIEKLKNSLHRSGAGNDAIDSIVEKVGKQLYEGISTKKIYKLAFGLLKKESKQFAAKYKLKRAIMELGPSGYPFEKYIAEILKYKGYTVKVGEIIKGHCVNHEIDVIAEKENQHFMIECKFHNLPGISCDVKIPLYIQARFKDVEKQWTQLSGHDTKFHQGWVVTNTKFTGDAIQYGTCAGLFLLGWNFPAKENLKDMIDASALYPLTCLTTLTQQEKQLLLNSKIVLCKELYNNPELLSIANIVTERKNSIMNEAHALCDSEHL